MTNLTKSLIVLDKTDVEIHTEVHQSVLLVHFEIHLGQELCHSS